MIERKFVQERLKEFKVQEFVSDTLENVGHSKTKIVRTPLGDKVIISASRPGLVVGRKGENINKLTNTLKKKFNLNNPQIEISEVENPNLDAQIVAERIASTLERFGVNKFKAVGHKTLNDVMNAGAHGVEITISGKVPSQRAKRWRFSAGYLKKCGDISVSGMLHSQAAAKLKSGTVGIDVSILPPNVKLPDDIEVKDESQGTERTE
ncbi:30S ribosomal protein S3 [Candidatus Woesearchaeota archaeon]|nr:30S ribosomal protein S3 [Candidatus Woesearchaeota archaeon]